MGDDRLPYVTGWVIAVHVFECESAEIHEELESICLLQGTTFLPRFHSSTLGKRTCLACLGLEPVCPRSTPWRKGLCPRPLRPDFRGALALFKQNTVPLGRLGLCHSLHFKERLQKSKHLAKIQKIKM